MPVFKIHHITKYEYDALVKESINEVRIFPYQCPEQEILQHHLYITGSPQVFVFSDYWKNTAGSFNLLVPHRELIIESKLVVRTLAQPEKLPGSQLAKLAALETETAYSLPMLELASADIIQASGKVDEIVAAVYHPEKPVSAIVHESSEYIFKQFRYIKGITNIETTVDEILEHKSGVCQDFAHVLLQLLRTMNIPSRYVSGYICPNKTGMRGEGATHAWVEAWIPQIGWAGIDPTNNVWVTDKHVKLAVGRDFKDCTPIKGAFKGMADQELSVHVTVGYEDGQTFEDRNHVQTGFKQSKKLPLVHVQAQQ